MRVINTEKKPIKLWLSDIEEGALAQAKNLANLPFTFRWVAIMPDSHQGYGMPIGGVLATENVIIPNAVGVDIGCGMCAVRTSLKEIEVEVLKKIMSGIRAAVPVGFAHQKEKQDEGLMPSTEGMVLGGIVEREYQNALSQIGTLGGGNHFIEIQKGSDGFIWVMIHSGSRNFGLKNADFYNKKAIALNEKWNSEVPKGWELAFLPMDSDEGNAYQKEMQYCVDFALANRKLMMERIKLIFAQVLSLGENDFDEMINIAHNYARLENHCSTCMSNQDNDNQLVELLLGDERVSKVRDFLDGYRPFVHSCGGLLLMKGVSVLKLSPSQTDALEQMICACRSLIQGLELKHNHFSSLHFCECVSPAPFDEAYYTSSNKFGLGFSHLFGVEKDYCKLDRILARIFLGYAAYDLDCKLNKDTHSISQVMVHRKGATLATTDTIGIIPGSQGTHSYIVKGKGNPESFQSCSHGAGRKMGRKQAQRELNLAEEQKKLDDKGILHAIRGKDDLDEAAGAYKNIDEVMENQTDLVEKVVELEPLAVIKG